LSPEISRARGPQWGNAMTDSPATDTAFLDDPRFWETFSGLFFNDEKLVEFAAVVGVTAEFIRQKRREQFPRYLMKMTFDLYQGSNNTYH
jgi:hypothetical protein